MGFFSKLKKVFNPGGAIVSKVINDGNDYKGVLDYAMNGADNAKKKQQAEADALRNQYSGGKPVFHADPGLNPQAVKLGWTNGGYRYHNSSLPQNGQQAPPMSFGGGGAQMGMSGPQQMQMGPPPQQMSGMGGMASGAVGRALQGAGGGGSMPPAGAQPSGPPTMQVPQDPQRWQAMMLRQRPM